MAGKDGAAWTAPDSWAVKGEGGAVEPDSSTDEEGNEEAAEDTVESDENTEASFEATAIAVEEGARPGPSGTRSSSVVGRLNVPPGRGVAKNGRPGTADGRAVTKTVSPSLFLDSTRANFV